MLKCRGIGNSTLLEFLELLLWDDRRSTSAENGVHCSGLSVVCLSYCCKINGCVLKAIQWYLSSSWLQLNRPLPPEWYQVHQRSSSSNHSLASNLMVRGHQWVWLPVDGCSRQLQKEMPLLGILFYWNWTKCWVIQYAVLITCDVSISQQC